VKKGIWTKGSRSNGSGGNNCVEVELHENGVNVRHSQEPDVVIGYTFSEWTAFTESVKLGEFDL
jgi:hypothetical protein